MVFFHPAWFMSVLAIRVSDLAAATGAARIPCVPERDTPDAVTDVDLEEEEEEERDDSQFISLSFYEDGYA